MIGLTVKVYRNLTRKTLSVQQKQKVIGYTDSILLENVTFLVGQSGRLRVLETKQKNVHARVKGTCLALKVEELEGAIQVTYNPFKHAHFHCVKTGRGIKKAALTSIQANGKIYCTDPVWHEEEDDSQT